MLSSRLGSRLFNLAILAQGYLPPSKLVSKDREITDTDLGHVDLRAPTILWLGRMTNTQGRTYWATSLVNSGLVQAAGFPISLQSPELVMACAENYKPDDRIMYGQLGEVVLDISSDTIE